MIVVNDTHIGTRYVILANIPVLALIYRWTLGFKESNFFLRVHEINNYKIYDNLVTKLIIVYILILSCADYTGCFGNIQDYS